MDGFDRLSRVGPSAGGGGMGSMGGGYPRGSGLGTSGVSYGAPPPAISSAVPANVAPLASGQAMVPAKPAGESKTTTYLLYGGGALLLGWLVYTYMLKDKAAAPQKRVQRVAVQAEGGYSQSHAPQGYAPPGYAPQGYGPPQGYAQPGYPQEEPQQAAPPITMGGSNVAMPRMGGGRGGGFGTGIQGIPAVPEGTYQH